MLGQTKRGERMMGLAEMIGVVPKHTFNEKTGLFEARLEGAFSYVIQPHIYMAIFWEMKNALVEFEASQGLDGHDPVMLRKRS